MSAHAAGIGRTALVTTCTWTPMPVEPRQQHVELAVAHERLAADDRQVQRPHPAHHVHHAVDQRLALVVRQLAQDDAAAEVLVAVRVAARTSQRTLTRDLE